MLSDWDRLVDAVRREPYGHPGLTGHHVEAGSLDDSALGHGVGDAGHDCIRPDARSEETDRDDDAERWHLSRLRARGGSTFRWLVRTREYGREAL